MTNEQAYKILNDAPEGAEYFHKSYYKIDRGIVYLWIKCEEVWFSLEDKSEFIDDKLIEENSLKDMEKQLRKSCSEAMEQAHQDMRASGIMDY
ncbi:MAG TPA: hypothetical protein VIC51_13795 [Psychromonas sp.]